jgi:CheY-like chemotaxis protein
MAIFRMNVNDPNARASSSHYRYSCNKSKSIPGLDSHDPKYYDQIITKLNLQAREQLRKDLLLDQTAISGSKKKRVLLVDDEPDICMVYQIVLQDAGYECISYTDSVKALQEYRPFYYDLILLDIKMPILNGFELCKKILELDRTVHIIFITASEVYYEQFRNQHYPELGKINHLHNKLKIIILTSFYIS